MAIPTWHIMDLFLVQDLFAIDKILQQFVEGVTNVKVSIGVRRAIVQNKSFASGRFRELSVEVIFLPKLLEFWFANDGVGTLAKLGFRKKNGRSKGVLWLFAAWIPTSVFVRICFFFIQREHMIDERVSLFVCIFLPLAFNLVVEAVRAAILCLKGNDCTKPRPLSEIAERTNNMVLATTLIANSTRATVDIERCEL